MRMRDKRVDRTRPVVAAVVLTVAVWVVAEPVLGFELRAPAQGGGGATHDIDGVVVAVAGAVASLAGWALLAVLERFVPRRARRIWLAIAVGVLVLSLGGPLSGAGIPTANKLWLVVMHLSVGAVLIPTLARTSHAWRGSAVNANPAPGHASGMAATGTRGESR